MRQAMPLGDCSGEDDKSDVIQIHPDRVGADPTEGWRRGARGALRKSCDTCTSSKTKCQGSIPCDRCKKRKIECKFSKRRRCGPKARSADDKRHCAGPREDSDDSSTNPGSYRQPSPSHHFPSVGTISLAGAAGGDGGGNTGVPLDDTLPVSPTVGAHRAIGFSAPSTAGSFSGLVDLIAPTLSDGGDSGSSGAGGREPTSYSHLGSTMGPAASPHFAAQQLPQPPLHMTFMGGGGTNPPDPGCVSGTAMPTHNKPVGPSCGIDSGTDRLATFPGRPAALRQTSLRSTRRLAPAHSAPSPGSSLPARELPPRSKSSGATVAEVGPEGPYSQLEESSGAAPMVVAVNTTPGEIPGFLDDSERAGVQEQQQQQLPSRGPLPMTLDARSKAHLRTFMRNMGSVVVLPGSEVLRKAMSIQGEGEDDGTAAAPAHRRRSVTRLDPMDDGVDDDSNDATSTTSHPSIRSKVGEDDDRGSSGPDVLAEACRAEAWAAIAVGALFGGAGAEEGKEYASNALRSLGECLDAPLPEVAAVMVLLTLFWLHSMDTRKVARYFGFARQVGLELGCQIPEGLRHSIDFLAVLVTMTLDSDQRGSLASLARDQGAWGVAVQRRSAGDPTVAALAAITVVCNRMLQDGVGKTRLDDDRILGASPPSPPSQALTDTLRAAADALSAANIRHESRNSEHLLALLNGLRAYTHAARDEMDDAEASATRTLEVVDRYPGVLHLPLTFALAEASRTLMNSRPGRSARASFPAAHVDALRVARASLAFARPAHASEGGLGGGGREKAIGGWCAFGDAIVAMLEKGVPGELDNLGAKPKNSGQPSRQPAGRTGSMSPPPERSIRRPSRADIASSRWQPTVGGNNGAGSVRRGGSLESGRWSGPSTTTVFGSASHRPSHPAADEPTDWVDRVRKMPVNVRSSSPGVVHRMSGTRSPGRLDDGNGMLGPGPMPSTMPGQSSRHVSDPVGLTLLSGVAAPGVFSDQPRRASYEHRHTGERDPSRRGGGAGAARGSGSGLDHTGQTGSGGSSDRDADDLPPQSNPVMTTGVSFDPNRDDPNFLFGSMA